ncbi:MAG: hypothetical protein QM493_09675 [Sulfurovum sp.]
MSKFFVSFFFLSLFLSAQSIYFKESKYHEALGSSFSKRGQIFFLDRGIKIIYSTQTLFYKHDTLRVEKGDKTYYINLDKKPSVKMFFILFEAIYFEKKKVLRRYFKITKNKNKKTIHLIPRQGINRYIDSVSYQKIGKKLKFLQINLSSKDRICIEEIY